MINEDYAKLYCAEDISLIENFNKAVADKSKTWHLHHRAEILPCGKFSKLDLQMANLYFKRPASELIFLPPREHLRLHQLGNKKSTTHCENISKGRKGMKFSDSHLRNLSSSHLGNRHTLATRKKMSKTRKGVPKSEEHKRKIKEALKRHFSLNV